MLSEMDFGVEVLADPERFRIVVQHRVASGDRVKRYGFGGRQFSCHRFVESVLRVIVPVC